MPCPDPHYEDKKKVMPVSSSERSILQGYLKYSWLTSRMINKTDRGKSATHFKIENPQTKELFQMDDFIW